MIDPGFGFGKTIEHNLLLVKGLAELKTLNCPILLGISNKSTIGHITDSPVEARLYGSIAMTTLAIERGASIIRTHNVKSVVDAAKIVAALTIA